MTKVFKKKTIILGAPLHFGMAQMVEKELENIGFEVINISFYNNLFKYKNLWEWISVKLKKDPLYKNKLKFESNESKIKRTLASLEKKADYALIIRPDVFPLYFIESLRSKALQLIAYQWDPMKRFRVAFDYIDLFDRFYTFDPQDKNIDKTLQTTNFYPVSIIKTYNKDLESEVYYNGSYSKVRLSILQEIAHLLKKSNIVFSFQMYKRNFLPTLKGRKFLSKCFITYEENIERSYNTNVILDITQQNQQGLSFRIFEAIGLQKKIITNNLSIKNYDFYTENNVFIYGHDSVDNLLEFIRSPYQEIATEIQLKYSFNNWINYILNEQPHTPLTIP